MIDFFEGWDLFKRLKREGYIVEEDYAYLNGKQMEELIFKKACELYNWKPAEPNPDPQPTDLYRAELELQTAESRLKHIYDIAFDWDGFRSVRGLSSLIDEIIACTIPSCVPDSAALEQVKFTKLFDSIPDFLSNRVSTQQLPFTWTYLLEDVGKVYDWADENGYKVKYRVINYSTQHEEIGAVLTIEKDDNNVLEEEKEA